MQKMSGDNLGDKLINSARSRFNLLKKKDARSKAGAIFSLIIAALIVWAWQIVSQPGHGRADISSTPSVTNGTNIDSNINTQSKIDGTNGGSNISVTKDGNNPASVMVNGQPVELPQNGSVHKSVGGTSVDVNVQNGDSNNNNSQTTSVFSTSNTNSFSSSNDQVNSYNYSYTSGGGSSSN